MLGLSLIAAGLTVTAHAEDEMPPSFVRVQPFHTAYVTGDDEKFRQHRWTTEDYSGGLGDSTWNRQLNETTILEAEGHALVGENDYSGSLFLRDTERGHVLFEFEEFRKYFDGSGGYYYPFNSFETVDLDRELKLDIGTFRAEIFAILHGLPDVTLAYEHRYRDGTKSRLTWAAVVEGATTKNIAPSWQEINEEVHTIELKLDETYAGFDWHVEQEWEFAEMAYLREERFLSANSTASQRKIRRQEQRPESYRDQTVFQAERWFWEDKAFFSSGYRFSELDNQEYENIFETDEFGAPTNFSNPKQVRGATATNQFISHTWVSHLMLLPVEDWNLGGRVKVSDIVRDSSSTYPHDNAGAAGSPPNGTIDQYDVSENDNKIRSFGHSLSARYIGIPRTAVYAEWEYDQTRNWLSEDRKSSSAGEVFSRESIGHLYRGVGTIGMQFSPARIFNATFQGRHRQDDIHYNNLRYTEPTTSAARSVFVDGQMITTDELSARFLLRPLTWLEPAFRYQLQHRKYETWGVPDDQNIQESIVDSHIYTWDLNIYPWQKILTTLSFSYQDSKVQTPASNNTTTAQAPTFNSDVYTWLMSASYAVNEKWQLNTYGQFSRAANWNDFVHLGGLPMGTEYRHVVAGGGITWQPNDTITVSPKYEFDYYEPNEHSEAGQYAAHIVWCEVGIKWS